MKLAMVKQQDVTFAQFHRQLVALGSKRFELGVKDELTQQLERRRNQSVHQLGKSVPWLKFKNTNDHHIYIRPEALEAVVLIDDISVSNLLQLDRDGVRCACVVETSELNFQAWVRVSNESLEPKVATCLGEILATRYDADLGSKDFRHFGRAVGFTNVKPVHQLENGYFPYSKIIEAEGGVTPNGQALINQAIALRDAKEREHEQVRQRLAAKHKRRPDENVHARFEKAVAFIFNKYGSNTNASRADASAALHLLFEGYSIDKIQTAMLASADIQSRRPNSLEDYVGRTIQWVQEKGNVDRESKR